MKTQLSILLGAFSLVSMTGAMAQTSAVTDPVGYITTNVKAGAPASPGISYLGASLVNKVEFTGTATAGAGTSVTFPAASFAVGAFGLNDLTAGAQGAYYLEITSGPNAGVFGDIVATPSATTLTLSAADPIGAMVNGQSVKIRKHHTVASLFGDNTPANPLTLTGGVDTGGTTDILELVRPTSTTQLFFNTEENAWVAGAVLSNNRTIAPGEGVKVRRRGAALPIVWVGHVKTGPTVLPVETGVNIVAVPRAVGSAFTYVNSGLLASGLTGGADTGGTTDIITQIGAASVDQIFYNTEETFFVSGATNVNANPLTEGTAIRILRRGAPFNWTVPAETIAN